MTLYKLRVPLQSLPSGFFFLFNLSFHANCREETRVKKARQEIEKRIKNRLSP